MWIRTQNRKVLVNCNEIKITPCGDRDGHYQLASENGVLLGTYDSEKEALSALDRIQDAFALDYKIIKMQ